MSGSGILLKVVKIIEFDRLQFVGKGNHICALGGKRVD